MLRHANRTHAMMNASGAEANLGNFEAAALAEQDVLLGNTAVVETDVHMAVGRVVLSEDVHRPEDLEPFRVRRHENLRLARMRRTIWIRLDHHDHDLAARVTGAGDVELLAVDHPFVAVEPCLARDVLRIRRRDVGFGHRVRRADFAVQQGLEPFFLLRRRSDTLEHFHVSSIGCGAVETFRGERVLAELGRNIGVVEIREPLSGCVVGQEEIP